MQSHGQDTSQSMEWSEEEKYEHVILDVKNLVTKFLREYVAENLLSFYENVSNEFFVIYGQKKNIFHWKSDLPNHQALARECLFETDGGYYEHFKSIEGADLGCLLYIILNLQNFHHQESQFSNLRELCIQVRKEFRNFFCHNNVWSLETYQKSFVLLTEFVNALPGMEERKNEFHSKLEQLRLDGIDKLSLFSCINQIRKKIDDAVDGMLEKDFEDIQDQELIIMSIIKSQATKNPIEKEAILDKHKKIISKKLFLNKKKRYLTSWKRIIELINNILR